MSRPQQFRVALAAVLVVLAVGIGFATTFRQLTLPEMLAATDLAFAGTVAAVAVEERDGLPWTVVEFEVSRSLAGPADQNAVTLAFLGGDPVTGAELTVSLMPRFAIGEAVLILAYDQPYYSPIVGFNQGLWRLVEGSYRDEQGRLLSIGPDGELLLEGEGAAPTETLDALARRLEALR